MIQHNYNKKNIGVKIFFQYLFESLLFFQIHDLIKILLLLKHFYTIKKINKKKIIIFYFSIKYIIFFETVFDFVIISKDFF